MSDMWPERTIPDIEGRDISQPTSAELSCIDQEIQEIRELKRELMYREQDLIAQRIQLLKHIN